MGSTLTRLKILYHSPMICEYSAAELEAMPTLCVGQCCSLKVKEPRRRIWLCRGAGGVSVEHYDPKTGRWETVLGGCDVCEGD